MKSLFVFALVAFILSACAGGPALSLPNCAEGICVKLQVVEPVRFQEPVIVIITVTTEKDIPDLGMTLYFDDVDIVVEGPQGWETDVSGGVVWKGGAGWSVAAKANIPILFTRTRRFPTREGFFLVAASASIPTRSHLATDSLYIHLTQAGGSIYLSGTPLPITPVRIITPSSPLLSPSGTIIPTPSRVIVFPPTPTSRP
jgi:hypothetical protein